MLVGIISDTHDDVRAAAAAADLFADRGVEVVLHAGDVVAPPVVPFFDGFEVHAVLGNNDGEVLGLHRAFEGLGDGSELHGRFAALRIDGVDVAMLHGEDREAVEALAESGTYDVVVYGHHHRRDRHAVGETTVLNPGAHFGTVPDDHRTVALFDTADGSVTFERVGPSATT